MNDHNIPGMDPDMIPHRDHAAHQNMHKHKGNHNDNQGEKGPNQG